jgi:hypothetical protein
MARGTKVFRIRIELIFGRCWNPITPWRSAGPRIRWRKLPAHCSRQPDPASAGLPRVVERAFGFAPMRAAVFRHESSLGRSWPFLAGQGIAGPARVVRHSPRAGLPQSEAAKKCRIENSI